MLNEDHLYIVDHFFPLDMQFDINFHTIVQSKNAKLCQRIGRFRIYFIT
jgi:hypothetical protein